MYPFAKKPLTGSLCLLTAAVISACVPATQNKAPVISERAAADPYWLTGRAELQKRLDIQRKSGAKNVILFVADGMGISTITAARIFDGQSKGQPGEENYLSFEQFPSVALVKTYNSDSQVPDSAGTASALNTGVKTRRGAINTWADQPLTECVGTHEHFPVSVAELAERAGLSTGIISTAHLTHATPAAVYGHSPSRQWESDAQLPEQAKKAGCKDLAQQMVAFNQGNGLEVMLGGGRKMFVPQSSNGERQDGRNLIDEWKSHYPSAQYVENAEQFRALDLASTDRLLGFFTDSHMAYEADRDNAREPSLAEMTTAAVNMLSRNDKGYFLMVEGGRVDHAHHNNNAYRALSDTQAFANAVQAAVDNVDLNETLILVTADHSHLFTIAGYPGRGNPILGLARDRDPVTGQLQSEPSTVSDNKPYTTLGYYFGTHIRNTDAAPLTEEQVTHPDYEQQAAIKKGYGGHHAGEDVALFATGPGSHLVGGVIEQHTVFHIITHALGWDF